MINVVEKLIHGIAWRLTNYLRWTSTHDNGSVLGQDWKSESDSVKTRKFTPVSVNGYVWWSQMSGKTMENYENRSLLDQLSV